MQPQSYRLSIARIVIVAGLLLVLSLFSYSVWNKEQILTNGKNVLVSLAPVDPRSLMQGDYMILNYDIPRTLTKKAAQLHEGKLVYTVNEKNVVNFIRLYQPGETLQDNEQWIHFRNRNRRIHIGANSFFFQEGKAKTFDAAKYGELRVDANGHSILVGLADEHQQRLGYTSGLQ